MIDIELLVTPGLGDNSYLVASGGEAAVIDPQRDVSALIARSRAKGVSITRALETHVHNDYISGSLELRGATGARIGGPARAGYAFAHDPLAEGDEVRVGDLRLFALDTPGHTPEHVSYMVRESGAKEPLAVFTGGSLMVGGAGRTDLLGPELTDRLTRDQYRTLRRLSSLPDAVAVLPTHGAGSFCGAGPALRERTSTVGTERERNRALAAPDEEAFVRQQLSGLLAFPAYYRHMAPINRQGPRPLADLEEPLPLTPAQVEHAVGRGALVVDGRSRLEFAAAHIPGSINVELEDTFASYVGWIVPFDAPIVLVLPGPAAESLPEAGKQLAGIGYEHTVGFLEGGLDTWGESGRPIESYPVSTVDDLCRAYRRASPVILDVRQVTEWERSRIPGSRHLFVGDLPDRLGEVPGDEEVWVICASGQRASIAASVLDRERIPVRLVASGGVSDWLRRCGG